MKKSNQNFRKIDHIPSIEIFSTYKASINLMLLFVVIISHEWNVHDFSKILFRFFHIFIIIYLSFHDITIAHDIIIRLTGNGTADSRCPASELHHLSFLAPFLVIFRTSSPAKREIPRRVKRISRNGGLVVTPDEFDLTSPEKMRQSPNPRNQKTKKRNNTSTAQNQIEHTSISKFYHSRVPRNLDKTLRV